MKKLIIFISIFVLSISFMITFSILGNVPRKAILKYSIIEENNYKYIYSSHIATKDKIFSTKRYKYPTINWRSCSHRNF